MDNSDEETEEQAKQCKKEEKAFDMLSEGADDYLDLKLVQVEKFLNEYLSLICWLFSGKTVILHTKRILTDLILVM